MALRIISGEKRSQLLVAPEGQDTRPLRDRLREALFSIIRMDIRDAVIFDAFGGSGAISFESLSNGARHATLVDPSPAAATAIRSNAETLGYTDRVTFHSGRIPEILDSLNPPDPFDFLFLMPPYHSGLCIPVLESKSLLPHLSDYVQAIGEIHVDEPTPVVAGWSLVKEKKYGITRLLFWERTD